MIKPKEYRTGPCPHGVIGFCAPCDDPARLTAAAQISVGNYSAMTISSAALSKEQKCVRCANGDTRTADGFHLTSAGHYKRCADLPPYEQPAMPTLNQRCDHAKLHRLRSERTHHYVNVWHCLAPHCEFQINQCEHNEQRQGERGPPYCADCGAQVPESLRPVETSRDDAWRRLHGAVASWSAQARNFSHPDITALNKILAAHNPFDSSAVEPKSTQPPDSRGDAALWVLAWLAMKGGLGSDVHEVIEAVMEGRAEMRPNNRLHIEPRSAENGSEKQT